MPMIDAVRRYFEFEKHQATFRAEVIGGATTFMTMSYIVVVNPKVLEAAGIPIGASMTATILTAVIGTLMMGLYARRPFAVAPYMGENAFISYTVVVVLGYPWQAALGAVFVAGVLFMILTALRLRQRLVEAVPECLRYSFAAGIGLFLTFIGLNVTGIMAVGTPEAPVRIGDLTSRAVLVAVLGFIFISALLLRRVPGAILIGILASSLLSFWVGAAAP
jgi:AGZA family xanthine/uracil permease-like MFS transporter